MKTTTTNYIVKTFKIALIISMAIATWSCSSDDDGNVIDDTSNCEQLLDGLNQELADASSAFSQNPTEANCEAYRTVALDFLDELEDCAVANAQYDAIEEAAQEVLDLDCTQFD